MFHSYSLDIFITLIKIIEEQKKDQFKSTQYAPPVFA